jgi:hypothetical protein
MKRSPRPSKTSRDLSPTTREKLSMYALAAGAAGVSMLALTQVSQAKIIYTPAHVPILGPRGLYRLDLNHDGVVDFKITNTTNYNTDQAFWDLFAKAGAGNAVIGTFVYRGFPPDARAMNSGSQIGASQKFFAGAAKMASFYVGGGGYSAHGNWPHATDRYLGVKFQIGSETHYGWARFTVQTYGKPVRIDAELTGYAYETVADTPIIAGQTSSAAEDQTANAQRLPAGEPAMLGLMAQGSRGLATWRREKFVEELN